MTGSDDTGHVYRVDKFLVPEPAREEFLARVRQTHEVLRTMPGFVRDLLLDQSSGPGELNIVTVVEWESAACVEEAKTAVAALRSKSDFDPQAMFARLGIRADLGEYRRLVP